MNIVKFALINRGLCAAERDWKKAFGRGYAGAIVKGKTVEFEDCGYADYVMDWQHEGQLCHVYLNERIIVKEFFLAIPERITCLSSVKAKRLTLKVFTEICATVLGINGNARNFL